MRALDRAEIVDPLSVYFSLSGLFETNLPLRCVEEQAVLRRHACVSEFQGKYESLALPLEYCPGVAAARTSFRLQKWTLWHTSIQEECHDDP